MTNPKIIFVKKENFVCTNHVPFSVYGYCQSIEDLRHNKDITTAKDLMTSECLLDNNVSQSGDRVAQTTSFKVTNISLNHAGSLKYFSLIGCWYFC